MIEAERFHASCSMMLVHSFSREHKWFEDYQAFLGLFGKDGGPNSITQLNSLDGMKLYAGWVTGEEEYLSK